MGPIELESNLSNDILLLFTIGEPRNDWIEKIKAQYPGLEIRWVNGMTTAGLGAPDAIPAETWEGVTLFSSFMPAKAELMTKVRFVQLMSAGVDRWPGHVKYEDPNVIFTSTNGIHA
jgi:hypothetical protein